MQPGTGPEAGRILVFGTAEVSFVTAEARFVTAEVSFGTAEVIFGTAEDIFGTAEVILHRRRDLRAGRLPLRLFGSDRNDDSQFSSRLALRR